MPPSHKGAKSEPPIGMQRYDSVTTFVPHRSLEDYEDGVGDSQRRGLASSGTISITPYESRRRALVRLVRHREGREALLQLLQSVLLLLYSLAPTRRRRRQLHLLSESISSFRKFVLVGRWLVEGSQAVQDQLVQEPEKGQMNLNTAEVATAERAETADEKSVGQSLLSPEDDQREIVEAWREAWHNRVESAAEFLGLGAETCDLLAFFGGSSMLWRIAGGKLAGRQRRGLERVALFLAFISMLLSLVHLRHLRKTQGEMLRRANQKLLLATDEVAGEDARRLLQGHELHPDQVLNNDTSPRDDALLTEPPLASPPQIDGILRSTEHQVFIEKKKLDHLKLERTAVRCELLFSCFELLWPDRNHSRLEGYTGIVASLCHITRLAGQSRWKL